MVLITAARMAARITPAKAGARRTLGEGDEDRFRIGQIGQEARAQESEGNGAKAAENHPAHADARGCRASEAQRRRKRARMWGWAYIA